MEVPEGHLLPHAHNVLVTLGSDQAFAKAAKHLEKILGVEVHRSTVCRSTLAVGTRSLEVQTQQAEPLASCPEEPTAARVAMNSDGGMVPLRGGIWAEVKLVAIGIVERRKNKKLQEEQVVTTKLSYFARMTDASTFATQASAEIRRRGVDRATEVCAIQDGAEWLPGFVQSHRHDALRILDFPHAAEYVRAIGEGVRASGRHLPSTWLDGVLHRLKHQGPDRVLGHLLRLCQRCKDPEIDKKLTYLQKRREQMDYPTYQRNGWPSGSGTVESGHKQVTQARLKGAGMHWKPEHVNPMLALRMALCNDRWDENWADQHRLGRQQRVLHRRTRAQQRFHTLQEARRHALPPPPPKPLPQKTGRTEAQKQWGRRTFSPRLLQQPGGAKL